MNIDIGTVLFFYDYLITTTSCNDSQNTLFLEAKTDQLWCQLKDRFIVLQSLFAHLKHRFEFTVSFLYFLIQSFGATSLSVQSSSYLNWTSELKFHFVFVMIWLSKIIISRVIKF